MITAGLSVVEAARRVGVGRKITSGWLGRLDAESKAPCSTALGDRAGATATPLRVAVTGAGGRIGDTLRNSSSRPASRVA